MARYEFNDVRVPIIVQNISGDLRLFGREQHTLIVEGDDPQVEQLGEGQPYVVNCNGDCRITLPNDVDVSVQNVASDAKLTDLGGTVDVQSVGADLILRSVGTARVHSVGCDLRVKWASGDVTVESVGSDATIREVEGSVWVASVGSDLYIRNIGGVCKVDSVGSDLVLNIDFLPDGEYHLNAGSDILCRVQPDTSARFIVPADVELHIDVPAEVAEDGDQQIITMGEGAATVYAVAGDSLQLVSEDEDYMVNLGVQIEEELESRLSTLEERLSQQLEGLDERITSKAQQWASQAEQIAERAQRQAERQAERARRALERRGRRARTMSFTIPGPPHAPQRPARPVEPVSEQERLMILQMVQENKISIEEAERLLTALEGQD